MKQTEYTVIATTTNKRIVVIHQQQEDDHSSSNNNKKSIELLKSCQPNTNQRVWNLNRNHYLPVPVWRVQIKTMKTRIIRKEE